MHKVMQTQCPTAWQYTRRITANDVIEQADGVSRHDRGQFRAELHPLTKQYLIADDPEQIAAVQAEVRAIHPRVMHVGPVVEEGASDAKESESAHD